MRALFFPLSGATEKSQCAWQEQKPTGRAGQNKARKAARKLNLQMAYTFYKPCRFGGIWGQWRSRGGKNKNWRIQTLFFPLVKLCCVSKLKWGQCCRHSNFFIFTSLPVLNVPVSCETPLMRERLLRKLW